ncbi:prepilin-type N-terminal cleavage/methylation domain-containing protein [Caenimonas sedimenti]|uniref:Prepilin-type N-terminal cleavage/methylation domain-containing protein n=1 Tax=Caenimonas sedimenti TaxID=2596921 RepID=A0A562ZKY5_9BURK|nr:PilW family protein [Caenimonas sedimenti]TWO69081.1 prepilin-type N-terminal cleavage/methylation domain-containing protein [Caenimonas sedimenti]
MQPSFMKRQRGLSLIELLVSLTIGLVLMVAVMSAYLGASSASRVAEAQGRMNEDAQAALNMLTQQLRMAGANPRQPNYATDTPRNPVFGPVGAATPTGYAIRGCDSTFTDPAVAMTALACSGTGSDAVAVAYEADAFNTVRSTGGNPTDCLGNEVPTTNAVGVKMWTGASVVLAAPQPAFRVAENKFYIADSAGVPSLFCKGNATGSTAQALVENVEEMHIRYGTLNDPAVVTDLRLGGYMTATELNNWSMPVTTPATDGPTKWAKVVTVRICIIVRSAEPIVSDTTSQRYHDCSGSSTPNATKTDLRLRRAYSTTVVLRNRVS